MKLKGSAEASARKPEVNEKEICSQKQILKLQSSLENRLNAIGVTILQITQTFWTL